MKIMSDKKSNKIGLKLMKTYHYVYVLGLFYSILRTYEDMDIIDFKETLKDFESCYNLNKKRH